MEPKSPITTRLQCPVPPEGKLHHSSAVTWGDINPCVKRRTLRNIDFQSIYPPSVMYSS